MLAPWSIRSSLSLGGPVLVSTNGGSNFLIGTIGEGVYDHIPDAIDCDGPTELASDHCRAGRAIDRIRGAPIDAFSRALLKLAHTFGHDSAPAQAWASGLRTRDPSVRESAALASLGVCRVSWIALLSLAIAGAGLVLCRRRSVLHGALFAPPVGIALTHVVLLGGDRYHAPAAASMSVLAALAWTAFVRRASATDLGFEPTYPRRVARSCALEASSVPREDRAESAQAQATEEPTASQGDRPRAPSASNRAPDDRGGRRGRSRLPLLRAREHRRGAR